MTLDRIGIKYINTMLFEYQISLAYGSGTPSVSKLLKERKKVSTNNSTFTILEEFENTLSHRLTIIKMYLKFITELNQEQHDYTKYYDSLVSIRVHDKITHFLTPIELNKVIDFTRDWVNIYIDYLDKSSDRVAYRNALMLTLYALTGARGDEVIHIKLADISRIEKDTKSYYIININKGKGGKKRAVSIEAFYIDPFLRYFETNLPNRDYYLSTTYRNGYTNKPMSVDNIRVFSNYILGILGIPKSGLHAYRRGYATKRIGSDKVDISIVAKELGNTSAILEKHYLKHCPDVFLS
jgi:integrase/recombinase XerD